MDPNVDIYEALSEDHRKIESLLDRLMPASRAGGEGWKPLVAELRTALIPHAHAEEAVLYNSLREVDQAESLVSEGYREHFMVEQELLAIEAAAKVGKPWTSMIEKLDKDLRHHIQDEESRVYEAAGEAFTEEEALQLGAAFLRLKTDMKGTADSMTESTLSLMANLMPPRLMERFRKNVHFVHKDAA